MRTALLTLAAALACSAGVARAGDDPAEAVRVGAALYQAHCARCHGESARGDGPTAASLEYVPADLTRISQRNRGKFPFDRIVDIVDGRKPVKGHGRSDMPVWGDVLLDPAEGYDRDRVKEKIRHVVHYLESIQQPKDRGP